MFRSFVEKKLVRKITSSIRLPESDDSETLWSGNSSYDCSLDFKSCASDHTSSSSSPQPKMPVLHRKELQLGPLLGQGAFAQVFAVTKIEMNSSSINEKLIIEPQQEMVARQKLLRSANVDGCSLAVKHLNRELLRHPKVFRQALDDLEREAHILSTLQNHPNIVQLRAVSMGGIAKLKRSGRYNDYFLVMNRCENTLHDRIEDQWKKLPATVPPLTTLVRYATQLASALQYLHQRRFIFRDCKPTNVGFQRWTGDGNDEDTERIQLFDFGLCRALPPSSSSSSSSTDMETFQMSMAGTTRYMSPEILLGEAYNCKADTYSFALVLYEMFSQKTAYEGIKNRNVFQQEVCNASIRPDLNSLNVPQSLKNLLEQAWCKSVSARLTIKTVLDELEGIQKELQQLNKSCCHCY